MRFVFCALLALGSVAHAQDSAADCYERARSEPGLSDFEALRLCRGADSSAPADCYVQARAQTFLTSGEARRLCTHADSTDPADCASRAADETFLERNDIVRLCAPSAELVFP